MCKATSWFTELTFFSQTHPTVKPADAIFVPGLCLAEDQTRLSSMNETAMRYAAKLLKGDAAKTIIYSSNINERLAQKEADLRTKLLLRLEVKPHQLIPLIQPWNSQTQDEVEGLRRTLAEHPEIKNIIAVTDHWHMPRLVYAMQHILSGVTIYTAPITFPILEKTAENDATFGRLKQLLWSRRPLWVARNVVGYIMTPFLIKKWTKS